MCNHAFQFNNFAGQIESHQLQQQKNHRSQQPTNISIHPSIHLFITTVTRTNNDDDERPSGQDFRCRNVRVVDDDDDDDALMERFLLLLPLLLPPPPPLPVVFDTFLAIAAVDDDDVFNGSLCEFVFEQFFFVRFNEFFIFFVVFPSSTLSLDVDSDDDGSESESESSFESESDEFEESSSSSISSSSSSSSCS
ncbi:hypothetical protein DERF_010071 [Dermatophagoides farinae]|uniref:Uncharacterized protein n=1 Tax=Dermatophagoides farinae TaxID=6954 RepID=A0A922HYK1_DERFA|nr:hypothetical protein DERF_010071 [Dermatophagoides farinae]